MAPEVQEEHFMSKASDIYSFAIMLQRFFPKTLDNIINHVDCHNILSTEHSERPCIHQIIEALTLPQNKEEHTRFLNFFQALKNTNLKNDVLAAPIIINPGTIAIPAPHICLELTADQNKNSVLKCALQSCCIQFGLQNHGNDFISIHPQPNILGTHTAKAVSAIYELYKPQNQANPDNHSMPDPLLISQYNELIRKPSQAPLLQTDPQPSPLKIQTHSQFSNR